MEDADGIRSELNRLIKDESKEVLVIAHSYGGNVVSQAVDKEFAKEVRQREGSSGGVIRIVYMCAFLIPLGQSAASTFGGGPPPDTVIPTPIDVDVSLSSL
jgi:hypothetical protein